MKLLPKIKPKCLFKNLVKGPCQKTTTYQGGHNSRRKYCNNKQVRMDGYKMKEDYFLSTLKAVGTAYSN